MVGTYIAAHDQVGRTTSTLGHLVLVRRRNSDEPRVFLVTRSAFELEHQRVILISRQKMRYVGELRFELQCKSLHSLNSQT